MKKTRNALMITFLLLSLSLVLASPHAFRGTTTYGLGTTVPDGYVVTAGVNGVISGSSTVTSGFYDLVMEANAPGQTVSFFLNGEKMNEEFNFFPFDITDLDLSINSLPAASGTDFCGDAICSADECSFCSVDCGPSDCNTNGVCDANVGETCSSAPGDCGICLGNGVCDAQFGETCDNAPQDCGNCPSSGGGGGGGGGGGSGGGGGGGSSTTTTDTATTDTTDANTQETEGGNIPVPSASELEEQIQQREEEQSNPGFFSWLTGAAVGGGSNTKGWIVILVILAILAWFVMSRRRKNLGGGRVKPKKVKVTPVKARKTKVTPVKKRKVTKKKVARKKKVVRRRR